MQIPFLIYDPTRADIIFTPVVLFHGLFPHPMPALGTMDERVTITGIYTGMQALPLPGNPEEHYIPGLNVTPAHCSPNRFLLP